LVNFFKNVFEEINTQKQLTMKQKIIQACSLFTAFLAFNLISLVSYAQEKGVDVDINVKKESDWYQQPWVWVVGAAVFILLLAAILKSNRTSKEA
jgi:hypothetical protein